MSSAEVVCCKLLPSITEELSIEANSMDPEQAAPIGVHTVCHKVFFSADEKSRRKLGNFDVNHFMTGESRAWMW